MKPEKHNIDDQAHKGGPQGAPPPVTPDEKLVTQVWQPRKVLEMNVYLLRNTGLDLQRWFEREIQALKGRPLRGGHA